MTHNPSEHESNAITKDIIQINFRRSPDHRTPIAGNNPRIKYFLKLGLVTNPQPNHQSYNHAHIHQRLLQNTNQSNEKTKNVFKNENKNENKNDLPKFPTKMIISQSVDSSISISPTTHPSLNQSSKTLSNLEKHSSTDSYLLSTINANKRLYQRRPRKLSLYNHRRNSNEKNRIRSKSSYSTIDNDTSMDSNINSNRSSIIQSYEISKNSPPKLLSNTHSRRRSRSYGLTQNFDFFDENSSSNAEECGTYTPPYAKSNILCHASRTPPGYEQCHNSMLITRGTVHKKIEQILVKSRKSTDGGSTNPVFILHSKPPKYKPSHSKPIIIHKNKPRFDVDFRPNVSSNFPESAVIPDEEMIDNSDVMFDMDSD